MDKRFSNRKKLPMQDNLFSDLTQILPHLSSLDQKIANLRWLSKYTDSSKVEIFMTLPDGTVFPMDQDIIPFNLQMESRKLIEDAIDEYQRQHDHLKKLFDETNH
jgi:hypothetical protein